jgi:hypothetical protein
MAAIKTDSECSSCETVKSRFDEAEQVVFPAALLEERLF